MKRQAGRGLATGTLTLLVTLLIALSSAGARADGGVRPAAITVQGDGTAAGIPDMAVLSAGVTAQSATAADAMADANKRLNAAVDLLRGFPIADKYIRTSRLQLNPVYPRGPRTGDEPPAPVGFRAEHQLTVELHEISRAGELVDRLVKAGIDRLGQLSFGFRDPGALMDEARRAAIADARRRAELYAAEAGVRLGRVLRIRETGSGGDPRPVMMRTMTAEAAPVIAPGEQQLRAGVTVSYAIEAAD
jgi:uncharacterized protein YggE